MADGSVRETGQRGVLSKRTRHHIGNSELEIQTGDGLWHLGEIAASELALGVERKHHSRQRQHKPARRVRSQHGEHEVRREQEQGENRVGAGTAGHDGQRHNTGLAVGLGITTVVGVEDCLGVECQRDCVQQRSPAQRTTLHITTDSCNTLLQCLPILL